jgi:hypothetical protein
MAGKKKDSTNRTRKAAPGDRQLSGPDWVPRFLGALRVSGNITAACAQTGVGRRTVYSRRDSDQDFAAQLHDAIEESTDLLEQEARRRAHDGVDEPVVYQGELMGTWVKGGMVVAQGTPGAALVPLTIKKYSDQLLVQLLKAHRPEKYRERYEVQHGGRVTTVNLSNLTNGDLDTLEAILDRAAVPGPGAGGESPPPPA